MMILWVSDLFSENPQIISPPFWISSIIWFKKFKSFQLISYFFSNSTPNFNIKTKISFFTSEYMPIKNNMYISQKKRIICLTFYWLNKNEIILTSSLLNFFVITLFPFFLSFLLFSCQTHFTLESSENFLISFEF